MSATFVLLIMVMVGATIAGRLCARYVPRSYHWVGPLQSFGVVVTVPVIALLGIMGLTLRAEYAWLPVFFLLFSAIWLGVAELAARWHRLSRADHGTFLLAAMLTNCGPTMVTSLVYGLITPADEALGMSQLFTLPWTTLIFTVGFPLGARYGHAATPFSLRAWLREIVSVRSLGLVGSLLGVALSLLASAKPELQIRVFHHNWLSWAILPMLLVQNLVFYFNIGHSLSFEQFGEHRVLHVSLAVLKFVVSPVLIALLLAGMLVVGVALPAPGFAVLMLQSVAPTAVFGTVISRMCGLNARLSSTLFVVNTAVFLLLVLPLFMLAMSWLT